MQSLTKSYKNFSSIYKSTNLFTTSNHMESDLGLTLQKAPIKFYGAGNKYGQFSNFYRAEITIDGKTFPTTEHYFQAVKFIDSDPEYFEKIRTCETPGEAKKLGKNLTMKRTDWAEVKYDIMKKALRAKFSQHEKLKKLLLGTETADIIENAPDDYQWGCGKDGSGQNLLGKALMDVREELKGTEVKEVKKPAEKNKPKDRYEPLF